MRVVKNTIDIGIFFFYWKIHNPFSVAAVYTVRQLNHPARWSYSYYDSFTYRCTYCVQQKHTKHVVIWISFSMQKQIFYLYDSI